MQRISIIVFSTFFISIVQSFAQTYNPEEAAAYAQEWCDKRNTRDYNVYSSDCANFVSQCLKAGGLDLSEGPYGAASSAGTIDNKGCIKGANELVRHLERYQQTTKKVTTACRRSSPNDFGDHDVGDPVFIILNNGVAFHSYICSSLNTEAQPLYCAHTENACDVLMCSQYGISLQKVYFHIKNTRPAHCDNCIQDADETGLDCGDSCPPCQHATEDKVYNYSTESNRLPAETYAISNITAGGANVTVYPGENVSFVTAGSIDLTPGFWAKQGCNFKADVVNKRLDATADCGTFCDPRFDGSAAKSSNYMVFDELINPCYCSDDLTFDCLIANASAISITIDQVKTANFTQNFYTIYTNITILSCQGTHHHYTRQFWVFDAAPGRQAELNDTLNHPFTEEEVERQIDIAYSNAEMQSATQVEINGEADHFSLYPNPTSGTLTITSSEPLQAFSDLTLTNNSGQIVYGQKYLDNFTLSLPPLPNGEYVLSVRINQQPVARKVILQR